MDRSSFTDRVMSRVAAEPSPSPGRVLARSVRHLAIRDAVAALAAAWRLAFEPASPVAASARASAAALFLSVIIVVGVGGAFVTGGALSLLGWGGSSPQQFAPGAAPRQTPAPVMTLPPTPAPTPSTSPTPTAIATPAVNQRARTEGQERTERTTPEPRQRRPETKEKRETPEPKESDRDERDERGGDDD